MPMSGRTLRISCSILSVKIPVPDVPLTETPEAAVHGQPSFRKGLPSLYKSR